MTLLTSCNDDNSLREDSGRMPIQFSTCDLTLTRADDGLNNNGTFFDGSTSIDFKIAVDGRNYTYSTAAANTAMTSTSPAYFPIDGTTSVKVQAYYPADKMQYATSAQTFTVAADQTTAAYYKASDLMYGVPAANGTTVGSGTWNGLDADGKVIPTTNPVPLVFTHKMVKIKVVVTPSGSTVNKVELKNINRAIPFDPRDGSLGTATAVTGTDVTMYNNTTGTTSTLTTTALIPKQTIATTVDFLTITTSDHTLNYRLPAEVTFDAGKQYIYNVTVNTDQITVTSNITDWGAETYTPGDGLAMTKNIKMNPLWYVAKYNISANSLTMGTSNTDGYYFTWPRAMELFSDTKTSTAYYNYRPGGLVIANSNDNYTYHMPVAGEWLSIFPASGKSANPRDNIWDFSGFKSNNLTEKFNYEDKELFGYNEATKDHIDDASYWVKESSTEMHALRFLGSNFCSAWKYVWTGNTMVVYATLIDCVPASASAASDYYTNESNSFANIYFGEDESKFAVRRDFYAKGYGLGNTTANSAQLNQIFHAWSASLDPSASDCSWRPCLVSTFMGVYGYQHNINTSFSVRLFRDN